jgi:hypothetical protein
MSEWFTFEPEFGWEAFDKYQELSDAIWDGLSESGGQWHYMNLTAGSSIWESRKDSSQIIMWYETEGLHRLVELKVSNGVASAYMEPIVKIFRLVSCSC